MKIFLTGSSGYIGKVLSREAHVRGHAVVAAMRRPSDNDAPWVPYDLSSTTYPLIPPDTNVVIHLAADTRGELSGDIELRAAKILLATAKSIDAKFIFISSQTAREEAPTAYGRTKWRIEREVLAAGGWVVRPGQVYGGAEEGSFGMIVRLANKLLILPIFLPVPLVQPVHVEDLARGILNLSESTNIPSGILSVAEEIPTAFTSFLKAVVRYRVRKPRLFVPIPVVTIRAVKKLFPIASPFAKSLTQLISLFELPTMDTAHDLETLGLHLRSMSIGMKRGKTGVRRQRLEEGRCLLYYVLRAAPSGSLLRRYTRAMEQVNAEVTLDIPTIFRVFPKALVLLEKRPFTPGARKSALAFHLYAAVTLAEATPQGVRLFRCNGPTIAFFDILRAVTMECTARLFQVLLWPCLRMWEKRKGVPGNA